MIKCSGCGRVYSDIVTICPICETVLREEPGELPIYDQKAAAEALELTKRLVEASNAENAPSSEKITYCGGCGNPLHPNARFCGNCGRVVRQR